MAMLLLSQGVPMILAGDEFLRTQRGNNNAWCQDNAIGWYRLAPRRYERGHAALPARADRAAQAPSRSHAHGLSAAVAATRGGRRRHRVARRRARRAALERSRRACMLGFTLAAVAAEEPELHAVINLSARGFHAPLPASDGRRWHRAARHLARVAARHRRAARAGRRTTTPSILVHAFTVVVLEGRA